MANPFIERLLFLFPTALWVWGKNAHGELGNAASVDANHPITTNFFPSGTTLRKLAASDSAPLDGSHSLAVDDGHHAFGWGLNSAGQVGNGAFGGNSFIPAQVCGTGQTAPCTQFIESVSAVAAGGFHSLALDGIGTVWGWGFDQSGQIGSSGGPTNVPLRNTPLFAQLHQQPGAPVVTAIAAGSNHSMALDSRGVLWVWGDNTFGQLGNGTFTHPPNIAAHIATPVAFPEPVKIAKIAAGTNHSLALDTNGRLWAWGSNQFGQLGLSSFEGNVTTPKKLIHFPANTRIAAMAGGSSHTLALSTAGRLFAFGRNLNGQLGNQTNIDSHGPAVTVFPAGTPPIRAIAAGGHHSLAVDAQSNLWAWGLNANGQLGNPQVGNRNTPILCQFPQTVPIFTVAAGTAHTIALENKAFILGLEAVLDLTRTAARPKVLPHSLSSSKILVEAKDSSIPREPRRKLLTVRMSDGDKHKLVIAVAHEKRDGKLMLEVRSLKYNNGKVLSPGSNQIEYELRLDKSGTVRSLRQHLSLKSKVSQLEINAHYDARRRKTTIHVLSSNYPEREIIRKGVQIIRVGTMNGALAFSDGLETWSL